MTTRFFRGNNYEVSSFIGKNYKLKGTEGNDWIEVKGSNNFINTSQGDDVIMRNSR